jgi:hypothetical protein
VAIGGALQFHSAYTRAAPELNISKNWSITLVLPGTLFVTFTKFKKLELIQRKFAALLPQYFFFKNEGHYYYKVCWQIVGTAMLYF